MKPKAIFQQRCSGIAASRIRNDLLALRNGFVRQNATTLLDAINMNEIRGPVTALQIH